MLDSFSFLGTYYPLFIQGTITTILISVLTVILGMGIGIIAAILKISRFRLLRGISTAYIELTRGTPVMVQIYIWYFGIGNILNIPDIYIGKDLSISRLTLGVVALALNSGAYVAEIIRAGILAVDKGQREAAESLGMKKSMTLKYIIIPQAIKTILPAIGNEFIVLIKESSILYIIGIQDLMAKTNTVVSSTFQTIAPFIVASAIYFVLTFGLSRLIGCFERRLNRNDRNK